MSELFKQTDALNVLAVWEVRCFHLVPTCFVCWVKRCCLVACHYGFQELISFLKPLRVWRSNMKILMYVLFHQTSWYPACTRRLWCPSSSWTLLCTVSVGNSSAVDKSEIVTHHFSPLMLCSHLSLLCWASVCIHHHVCLLDDFQTHFTIFQHAVLHYAITIHLHQFVMNINVRNIFHQFKPDHITNSLVEQILQCYCFCTLMYHMSSILHHVSYVPLATGAACTQKVKYLIDTKVAGKGPWCVERGSCIGSTLPSIFWHVNHSV